MAKRKRKTYAPNMRDLFERSAGGIQVTGDSGSGKSNCMLVLMQYCVRMMLPFMFIDPHGRDAKRLKRWFQSRGRRYSDKLIYIEPANESMPLPCINPLGISGLKSDVYRRAEIAQKVGHVANILLSAWGENDGFTGKPRLFTWTYRILHWLANLGLSMADAVHFLDIGSPIYQLLVKNVGDFMDRNAFLRLESAREREQEEQLESTRNRMLGFLKQNPLVTHMLGRTTDCLDFRKLIREGYYIVVDLNQGEALRDEDQQIFANLYLAELLHTVFSTPEEDARPYFAFIDELPVFGASFPQITRALAQVRKFQLRFVLAHQGVNLFPDQTNDRLLHACTSMCGVKLYFRHVNPLDAKYFGEVLGLRSYDALRKKYVHETPMIFPDGHDYEEVLERSTNWSDTETSSHAHMQGETLKQAMAGIQRGTSDQRTDANSRAGTTGGSVTYKKVLIPKTKIEQVVSSVQFFTPEEHNLEQAHDVAGQEVGEARLYVSGDDVLKVQFPLAQSAYENTPKTAAKKDAAYGEILNLQPGFATAEELAIERETFTRQLGSHLSQRLSDTEKRIDSEPIDETDADDTPPEIGI